MVDVPSDAALAAFINNHQGETINVPAESYHITNTIRANSGTRVNFAPGGGQTKVTYPNGSFTLFSINGGHIGGNLSAPQGGNSFARVEMAGNAQFGDSNGRIFLGRAQKRSGRGGDRRFLNINPINDAVVMNVTNLGPRISSQCDDDQLTWSDYSGRLVVRGCHFENFGNNGFYLKMATGRFECYDTYFRNVNVAALRHGCNRGSRMERCCVVSDKDGTGACSAGKGNRNHSLLSVQDGNPPSGDVVIKKCDLVWKDGGAAAFMLRSNRASTPVNVLYEDCAWTDGHFGGAAVADVTTRNNQQREPRDSGGPYPFGGGGGGSLLENAINVDGENTIEFVE